MIVSCTYIPRLAWGDTKALRLNGSNQDAWVRNPSFKSAASGAFATWVRFPAVLGANGSIVIRTLGNSSADEYAYFCLRRNSGYDAPKNVIEIFSRVGGAANQKSGSTTIAANTWYLVGRDSNSDLWVDGVLQTATYWRPPGDRTPAPWHSSIPGTTKDLSYGALRWNGGIGAYAQVDINDSYEFNAPLTAPEWAALYAAGMGVDPSTLGPTTQAKIVDVWDFENRSTAFIGPDNLTLTNSPSYVTP